MLLALLAAVAYGASDFLGGRAATRASVITVAVVMQATSLLLVLPVAAAVGPRPVLGTAIAWGAASGIGGAMGSLSLYRGLSRARVAVVAPLSGVLAAALAVAGALLTGERPGVVTAVGVVIGLPAVWLIAGGGADTGAARSAGPERRPAGVVEGVLAGIGFGGLFFALDRAGGGQGFWPVAAGQSSALLILVGALLTAALLTGRQLRPARDPGSAPVSWVLVAIGSGVLAIIANVAFFLAAAQGLLTVAAVLTSLYPAGTVVLARLVLDERISGRQAIGLALAGLAVVLITLG